MRVTDTRSVPEIGGERGSVDDLAGVENAVRIERPLDLAERLVQHGPEHLPHERAAHEAVTVLARQRAAEFEDEIGDGIRQ